MLILESFRIQPKQVIAFVGAGGKTTAMFRLAEELAAQGKRVITTTTTRIFAAQIKLAPFCLSPLAPLEKGGWGDLRAALQSHPHILIVGETNAEDKALGVPREFVDQLIALDQVDVVIYEADGARMRPFKAPATHEPVIAASTTLLVPVVGIHALGVPLDEKNTHRPEVIARVANAELGQPITADMIARVVAHPEAGLKEKPRGARVIALVNQVESEEQLGAAREIARRLLESTDIEAVAIGAVENAVRPIRETHRRVAAVITAAGAGTRMQGRIKQLLPWRGKTLIENAIEIATQSEANEIIVVLGAHAEEIQNHLAKSGDGYHAVEKSSVPVRFAQGASLGARPVIVLNPGWREGHASSIRAALDVLSPQTDAAIFINADQPLLTPTVVNKIIQRYRETDANIIVPSYAGKRGSPVLFRREHFDELRALRGEQGGRELIAQYAERVQRVEFEDARLGADVDTLEEYERLRD